VVAIQGYDWLRTCLSIKFVVARCLALSLKCLRLVVNSRLGLFGKLDIALDMDSPHTERIHAVKKIKALRLIDAFRHLQVFDSNLRHLPTLVIVCYKNVFAKD